MDHGAVYNMQIFQSGNYFSIILRDCATCFLRQKSCRIESYYQTRCSTAIESRSIIRRGPRRRGRPRSWLMGLCFVRPTASCWSSCRYPWFIWLLGCRAWKCSQAGRRTMTWTLSCHHNLRLPEGCLPWLAWVVHSHRLSPLRQRYSVQTAPRGCGLGGSRWSRVTRI